jgi:hypothetical protein
MKQILPVWEPKKNKVLSCFYMGWGFILVSIPFVPFIVRDKNYNPTPFMAVVIAPLIESMMIAMICFLIFGILSFIIEKNKLNDWVYILFAASICGGIFGPLHNGLGLENIARSMQSGIVFVLMCVQFLSWNITVGMTWAFWGTVLTHAVTNGTLQSIALTLRYFR